MLAGMDAITQVPVPANEPVHDYAPKSPERTRLRTELAYPDADLGPRPAEMIGRVTELAWAGRTALHRHLCLLTALI